MARRFRRRPRVVWFYPTGTPFADSGAGFVDAMQSYGLITFDTSVTVGSGAQPTFEIPLVVDNDPERTFTGAPLTTLQAAGLNQAIEYGYRLRRIVGSIHLIAVNDENQALPAFTGAAVTAGIIVRKVESDTGTAIAPGIDVNPQLVSNFPDPWIWRRTWVLNAVSRDVDVGGNDTTRLAYARFPDSTAEFGDVRSGPHVDAKTARIIGPEERLFLDIGVQGLPLAQSPGTQENMTFRCTIDLRVLGTIRTNQGNRRNASR